MFLLSSILVPWVVRSGIYRASGLSFYPCFYYRDVTYCQLQLFLRFLCPCCRYSYGVYIGITGSLRSICYFLQLSFDLLESWLANNQDAAGFKKDGQSIFRELALFQDYHGLPAFKKVSSLLLAFLGHTRAHIYVDE
jgi:hypothetical protein